ncbi:MAG TPA: Bd3614 family nucleic acid deaminase [Longimicrobium sp.]|nr:Bd3614 family nucleic acid deaminase [Longimicrobium sp.]
MATVTAEYALMALAYKLREQYGADVALLLAKKPEEFHGSRLRMFAGFNASPSARGHTAVVNLIQNLYQLVGWGALTDSLIFCTTDPSPADMGIFIEQMKASNQNAKVRLYFVDGGTIVSCRPTKLVVGAINPKPDEFVSLKGLPPVNGAWPELVRGDAKLTLDPGQKKFLAELLQVDTPIARVLKHLGAVPYRIGAAGAPRFDGRQPQPAMSFHQLEGRGADMFDSILMLAAYALASPSVQQKGKQGGGAKVGAVLASATGEILSWGTDRSATFHAEVTTIKLFQEKYHNDRIPDGARLYTSLEPCFMCSGLLASYKDVSRFTVLYGQTDPAVHNEASTFLKGLDFVKEIEAGMVPYLNSDRGSYARHIDSKAAKLGTWKPKKYAKSVMQQMEVASFSRVHAKAVLHLAGFGIAIALTQSGKQEKFLTALWKQAVDLVSAVGGLPPATLLARTGKHLDDTRGMNPALQQDAPYMARPRAPNKWSEAAEAIAASLES